MTTLGDTAEPRKSPSVSNRPWSTWPIMMCLREANTSHPNGESHHDHKRQWRTVACAFDPCSIERTGWVEPIVPDRRRPYVICGSISGVDAEETASLDIRDRVAEAELPSAYVELVHRGPRRCPVLGNSRDGQWREVIAWCHAVCCTRRVQMKADMVTEPDIWHQALGFKWTLAAVERGCRLRPFFPERIYWTGRTYASILPWEGPPSMVVFQKSVVARMYEPQTCASLVVAKQLLRVAVKTGRRAVLWNGEGRFPVFMNFSTPG